MLVSSLQPRVLSLVHEARFGFTRDGNSSLLGGKFDVQLLASLRQQAEIIVTSGKTAEIEQYKQPNKPLVILSTRTDAAPWLKADRFRVEDVDFMDLIANKKTLFETGLSLSQLLYKQSLIDQIVVHHDLVDFDHKLLGVTQLRLLQKVQFHDRYISLFGRGS
jgi:hypothetical protein